MIYVIVEQSKKSETKSMFCRPFKEIQYKIFFIMFFQMLGFNTKFSIYKIYQLLLLVLFWMKKPLTKILIFRSFFKKKLRVLFF